MNLVVFRGGSIYVYVSSRTGLTSLVDCLSWKSTAKSKRVKKHRYLRRGGVAHIYIYVYILLICTHVHELRPMCCEAHMHKQRKQTNNQLNTRKQAHKHTKCTSKVTTHTHTHTHTNTYTRAHTCIYSLYIYTCIYVYIEGASEYGPVFFV